MTRSRASAPEFSTWARVVSKWVFEGITSPGFAMTLNSQKAVTVPAYFAGLQGSTHGLPWPQIAAGALLFVAPIIAFTFVVRRHLLRGVTFGTIKQ